ncbi:MAG TPA: hypothetical protein VMU83_23485 [Hanamia sp.]|nr:hypothetical protein [Hanamia sp.]
MNDLSFIKDPDLRKTLEDSIEYIYTLIEQAKREEKQLYKEETYRVIILYVVSAIEAVLLYLYKTRGEKITYTEYKNVHNLPTSYIYKEKPEGQLVIAVAEQVEKKEYQIGLHDLVKFFKQKNILKDVTANEILEINDVRNTFHFSKFRTKACDLPQVEAALKLLVYTLERAPYALKTS